MSESYLERRHELESLSVPELVTLLMEHEESRREEENMKHEGKEMKVGDIIITKNPKKDIGRCRYHEIFQINAQHGNMVFVTKLKYSVRPLNHEDGYDKHKQDQRDEYDFYKHMKYNVKFDENDYSCWEYKKVLLKEYEKFDENKTYET